MAVSFGKVADRERKHLGEESFGHLGASGKEASGIRGDRAPGQIVARAFLGLFTVLGRLTLGPGPIGALGLGRLARGTEPGPMVPIKMYGVDIIILHRTCAFELNLFVLHHTFSKWIVGSLEKLCSEVHNPTTCFGYLIFVIISF